jgi:hypothetical protein
LMKSAIPKVCALPVRLASCERASRPRERVDGGLISRMLRWVEGNEFKTHSLTHLSLRFFHPLFITIGGEDY